MPILTNDPRSADIGRSHDVRYVLDILAVLMIVAAVGAFFWHKQREQQLEDVLHVVGTAVESLELEAKYRAATGQVEVNGRGFATTIDPAWFGGAAPRNPLVSPDRPWLEIAATDEATLTNPPIRVALNKDTASFWYNPANGIVRARVGQRVSDRVALEQYNRVNGTRLDTLFDTEPPREPAELISLDTDEDERPRTVVRVRRGETPTSEEPEPDSLDLDPTRDPEAEVQTADAPVDDALASPDE